MFTECPDSEPSVKLIAYLKIPDALFVTIFLKNSKSGIDLVVTVVFFFP